MLIPATRAEAPAHLNSTGHVIRNTSDKGLARGVFGNNSFAILRNYPLKRAVFKSFILQLPESPAQAAAGVSPVLLFGRKTTPRTENTLL